MSSEVPDIASTATVDDLTRYWRGLNLQIEKTESRYPFIITTMVTVFVGLAAARGESWLLTIKGIAPYVIPVVFLLGLTYVLALFRRVAVLRGYSAFVEDEINSRRSDEVYLWNSQYINRFDQNSAPNILMMLLTSLLIVVCIWALTVYVTRLGHGDWFSHVQNSCFTIALMIVFVVEIVEFARNDTVRAASYQFAMLKNHEHIRPSVCLYPGRKSPFDKCGIGTARANHKRAAQAVGLHTTSDLSDPYYRVLHVNTWDPGAFRAILRARKANRAVVMSAHSTDKDFSDSVMGSGLLAPLFDRWLHILYSRADYLVAPSQYAAKQVRVTAGNVPIEVVSGGVDTHIFRVRSETPSEAFSGTMFARKLREDVPIVLGTGMTFRRKGFVDFVDVARAMPGLMFVWSGPILHVFAGIRVTWSLLTKPQNLVMLGYLKQHQQVARAMSASHVYLALAHEENEGLAVLEARACGLPMVVRALEAYGLDCAETQTIIVGQDADVTDICHAIDSLLMCRPTEEERERLAATAAEKSLEKVGTLLADLYSRVTST